MDSFRQDLKYAFKLVLQHKAFSCAVVLTLGLALGANTAVFSVVDSVLLEPLPFDESDRLVTVFNSYPNAGAERVGNAAPDYFDRVDAVPAFESLALYATRSREVGTPSPQRVVTMSVTPSFFRVLGVDAAHGRTFTEAEKEPGHKNVVLLTDAFYQQVFAGAPDVVGRDMRIDGEPFEIVGVLAPDFLFTDPEVRLYTPMAFTPRMRSDDARHSNNWEMIGRLAPGATLAHAQTQLDALNAANLERFPDLRQLLLDAGFHTETRPFLSDLVRDVRSSLQLLWGGVGLVLLIACVNLINLTLVRSTSRAKELSTRLALGAGLGRVARQLLTESLLLAGLGGAAGLVIGGVTLRFLGSLGVDHLPRGTEIALDASTVILTLAVALVIGLVLGSIPILRVLRLDIESSLRGETRGGTESRSHRFVGRILVASQVAFAFVLLIGAGLLLASFREVLSIDPGFQPRGVWTARIALPAARYAELSDRSDFTRRVLERLRALPGVEAAGVGDSLPLGGDYSDNLIFPEGYRAQPGESVISPSQLAIGPGYLEAMGMEVVAGRAFDERDTAQSPRTILVDQRLAERFWGDGDPVGRRMFQPGSTEDLTDPGPDPQWLTVVGVVKDVRLRSLESGDERFGAYYLPITQSPRSHVSFAIRTSGDPGMLASAARAVLRDLDTELPLYDVHTMEERIAASLTVRRSPMLLALCFSAIALLLAALGIYGVLAYVVARRTREMGIRMALGSSAQGVFRLILGEGLAVVAAGLGLGFVGALALGRFLGSLLYGVEPLDPSVLAIVAALLVAVAFGACALPARRASRIRPAVALHE